MGTSNGPGTRRGIPASTASRDVFMPAYDALPREIRDVLKDVPIDMSALDAQMLVQRRYSLRDIARLFREHAHLNYQEIMVQDFGERVG